MPSLQCRRNQRAEISVSEMLNRWGRLQKLNRAKRLQEDELFGTGRVLASRRMFAGRDK